jgi:YfiH family protein
MKGGIPFESSPVLSKLSGVAHGFFGRRGGVSTGLYDSLNVGEGSGDRPSNIARNRTLLAATLGADHLLSCYQVHSASVVPVQTPWTVRPQADAMVTDVPGIGLCILTADCTPVLFADSGAGIIGAAHAGWKGALAGALEKTVEAMVRLGAERTRIQAAIGPTIGQASYEVGPEFRDTFMAQSAGSELLFLPGKGDRFQFDLPGFARQRLDASGIGQITDIGHDTCAMEDTYFSNRRRNHRGEPDYGRNGSVIMLTG